MKAIPMMTRIETKQRVRITLVLIGLAGLILYGCKQGDGPIVGKWRDYGSSVIVFKSDLTFKHGDGPGSATGSWALDGKKVTVTILQIDGKPPEEALRKFAARDIQSSPYFDSQEAKDKAINQRVEQMKKTIYVISEDGKTMSHDGEEPSSKNTLAKVDEE